MRINLKNNTGLKILSLVIAIILWYMIGNIDDPVSIDTYTNIPVHMINDEVLKSNNKAYEITEGATVTITVRGKSSILDKLSEHDFTATADLEKLSLVNAVPIDVSVARYSEEVDISLGRVNTVKVNVEDRVEAMIPVVVETKGQVADGYAIGTKTSSPNMVEIVGAESAINRLKEIRVVVNVDGYSHDITTSQSIKFYDRNGDEVEAPTVDCDIESVSVDIDLWRTKEINLVLSTAGTPAEGFGIAAFDYEPKTVEIAAPAEKLEDITELKIDPLDVTNASGNVEKTISLDSSALPSDVVFSEGSVDVVAKAVIEEKMSHTVVLKASDIQIKPEGTEVVFDSAAYNIEIVSYKSKIANLNGASFTPYVDVAELNGQTTGVVSVHLINPEGVTVTTPVKATVTLE